MSSKDKRKLAAIMFTDIAGYTALSAKDENKALELIESQNQILNPIIERFNGILHNRIGDGMLFTFPTVTDALKCGIEIQKKTQTIKDLNLRIGIHEGEITLKDGDALGDDVNVASRIVPFSAIGGIVVSGKVEQNILSLPEFKTKFVSKPSLQGVNQEVKIYCIVSHELPETDITTVTAKLEEDVKKLWFNQKFIFGFIIILFFSIIGVYQLIPKSEKISPIKDVFLIHFSSDEEKMSDYKETDRKQKYSYNLISQKHLNLIRKNVIPMINTKIAELDIYPYYTATKEEYNLFNKLPRYDSYYTQIERDWDMDTIPNIKDQYFKKLKEINDVFDFFIKKYNKKIDTYISVQIAEINIKSGKLLGIFPTFYDDDDREHINDGFWEMCNNCDLQWDEDSLQIIYDEITWLVTDLLKTKRYGGNIVGYVEEIIDTNIISIDLKNENIIKGMKLGGHRVWDYGKGKETLDQYITDKESIINYYNNNPNERIKLKNKNDWRPTPWYPEANNIDELLLLFEQEIDSFKFNYEKILVDWGKKTNRAWDSIMSYNLEIIKVSDGVALGKIISRNAPYVTPQKGDHIGIFD